MYEKDEGRKLVDHCQHLPWPGDMRRIRLSEKSWRPTKQRMGFVGCSGYTAQGWKKMKGPAHTVKVRSSLSVYSATTVSLTLTRCRSICGSMFANSARLIYQMDESKQQQASRSFADGGRP